MRTIHDQAYLDHRRRWLKAAGFVRDARNIWSHPDGRALGEGVAMALTEEALARYLGLDAPIDSHNEQGSEQDGSDSLVC